MVRFNRIEAGKNYGWPEVEGRGGGDRYVEPLATFATDDASPSGLAVLGDDAYLACLRGEKVYRLGVDGGRPRCCSTAHTAGSGTSRSRPTACCGC